MAIVRRDDHIQALYHDAALWVSKLGCLKKPEQTLQAGLGHYKIWKYCQSTSRVQA